MATTGCVDDSDRSAWRNAARLGWVAIWLVFLGSPLQAVWEHNGAAGRVVGVAAVVAFGVLYVLLFAVARSAWHTKRAAPRHRLRKLGMLAALPALFALTVPFAGSSSLIMLVYVGAAAVFTLPANVGVVAVVLLAVVTEVSARTVAGWHGQQWSTSLSILFAGAAVYAARLAFARNVALMAAREEMAQMAVEEERSRMTRDLHDILGHSLTVITIKAELAGRLVGTDEGRAAAEICDIERLAREALTDVRATIAGRRRVSLAPELVNARQALASAYIDSHVPGAVDDVPAGNRELFGWTVREGVTNVLRHSKASRCEIRLSGTAVEIHDDGVGAGPSEVDGSGLRGLRERVSRAGGSIVTGSSPELGGFLLKVSAGGERG